MGQHGRDEWTSESRWEVRTPLRWGSKHDSFHDTEGDARERAMLRSSEIGGDGFKQIGRTLYVNGANEDEI